MKRLFYIDILKVACLFLIVLAHVGPPLLIAQFRNFDVPLLIMVSAILYKKNSISSIKKYFVFAYKRFKRLVKPTWFFLVVFFVSSKVVIYLAFGKTIFSMNEILHSLFLSNFDLGINGVWIIRIFLLLSILAPIIDFLKRNLKSKVLFLFFLFILFLLSSLFITDLSVNNVLLNYVITHYLFYIFPYSFVYGIGLCLSEMSKKGITNLIYFIGAVFLVTLYSVHSGFENVFYNFIPTQLYKYPPKQYYIFFGLLMSLILYKTIKSYSGKFFIFREKIQFLSRHSLTFFFWHIGSLYYWEWFLKNTFLIFNFWIVRYVFFLILAISLTYLQYFLSKKLLSNYKKN